jgi:hypothetical protein
VKGGNPSSVWRESQPFGLSQGENVFSLQTN